MGSRPSRDILLHDDIILVPKGLMQESVPLGFNRVQ